METLINAFSLEPFDLILRHYIRNKYNVKEVSNFTGTTKLDRTDKSEVLWFINTFIRRNYLFLNLSLENYIPIGQKVERMLTQAPAFESSDAVNDWIVRNWSSFV